MPVGEQQRLAALHERRILDTPAEERFDRVTRLARRLFNVDEALVNLIDHTRQWTKSTSNGPSGSGNEVPRHESFCTTAIMDRQGVVVEDALLDDRFRHNPHVTCANPVRFYAGIPIAAPGGELVGTLCLVSHEPRLLSPADIELLRDLAGWVEKELNLDSELDRAAEVQRALLPAAPPDDERWSVAGACRPSRDVGGDFYDWHRIDGGTMVVLADVMGKGMPAAIVAATARAALRAGADASPGRTLTRAAAILDEDLHATETFVTAFAAVLGDDGHLRYADAGHGHAAILRADGSIDALARGRTPIGVDVDEPGDASSQEESRTHTLDHEAHLDVGDALIVHSDGLFELPFGPRDTRQLLTRLRGAQTASDALARIGDIIGTGNGNPTATDDLTALIICRANPAS
jgi:hypothetical protein